MENPWKGVVPYTENDSHSFVGRKKETKELFEVVKHNFVSTLYGRSGIGKTSLLKVGLYPALLNESFYPISIRLYSECSESENFAAHIINKVKEELDVKPLEGFYISTIPIEEKCNTNYLWNFFGYNSFISNKDCINNEGIVSISKGDEVIPVIVLDQFEEILREQHEETVVLIRQILSALQDGFLLDGSQYTIAFRFIISLREDDLYLLEDLLDEQYIDTMKRGRYRLRPLEIDSAREIIFVKQGFFDENDENVITEIIKRSDQEGQISTLLLSLVCFMIFESATTKQINHLTSKDINELIGEKPLETFYKKAIDGIGNETMDWIESHFVKDNRRLSVSLDTIPESVLNDLNNNRLMDESFDHHLFTPSSKSTDSSFELLHDKLAVVMSDYEKQRIEKLRAERLRKRIIIFVAVFVTIITPILAFIITRNNAASPKQFNRLQVKANETIPNNCSYCFPDGTLRLSKCKVLQNTFCNKDVHRLEIDSVYFFKGVALYLPNLDTLVLGGYDYDNEEFFNDSIQSVRTLVAKRPLKSPNNNTHLLRNLSNVIIAPEDTAYVRWNNGTLFVYDDSNNQWQAKIKSSNTVKLYYDKELFQNKKVNGASPLQQYDIANPIEPDPNSSVKLVCSDSHHTYLCKEDVPDKIRDKIVRIDLSTIDSIGKDVFGTSKSYYNNNRLQTISCHNVKVIADSAFMNCKQLQKLDLPRVKRIGKAAFMSDNSLKTINIDSARIIDDCAFKYDDKIEKVYLPLVEKIGGEAFSSINQNTKCLYNPDASIGNKPFGWVSPENLFGKTTQHYKGGYHYDSVMKILYIDSTFVDTLPISKYVLRIQRTNEKAKPIIGKVDLDPGNLNYYLWKGDVYLDNKSTNSKVSNDSAYIVIETKKDNYVSLPTNVSRRMLITGSNVKQNYISIHPNEIGNTINNGIVLRVPYGQKDKYFPFETSFARIDEMTWLETLKYEMSYRHPHRSFSLRCWISRITRYSATASDWISVTCCLWLLILMLFVFHRINIIQFRIKSIRSWIFYVFIPILLGAIVWLIVFVTAPVESVIMEDGKSFYSLESMFEYLRDNNLLGTRSMSIRKIDNPMWPILLFIPELWMIYFLLINRRSDKSKKSSVSDSVSKSANLRGTMRS